MSAPHPSLVTVHVYDISHGLARTMSANLIGVQLDYIPHTGVVLHGVEYFYGGGVQALPACDVQRVLGHPVVERLALDATSRTPDELRAFLRDAARRFTPESYDLLRWNCNHFSSELVAFLLPGATLPDRIVRVPEIVLASRYGGMLTQMLGSVQGDLARRGGAGGDPFAALADAPTGGGTAPLGARAGTGVGGAPPQRLPPPPPPASQYLRGTAHPMLATEPGDAPALVARLLAAAKALPEASAARPTAAEVAAIEALPGALALACATPSVEDAGAAHATVATAGPAALELAVAARAVTRALREWLPAAEAVPALALLRVLALHVAAAAELAGDEGGAAKPLGAELPAGAAGVAGDDGAAASAAGAASGGEANGDSAATAADAAGDAGAGLRTSACTGAPCATPSDESGARAPAAVGSDGSPPARTGAPTSEAAVESTFEATPEPGCQLPPGGVAAVTGATGARAAAAAGPAASGGFASALAVVTGGGGGGTAVPAPPAARVLALSVLTNAFATRAGAAWATGPAALEPLLAAAVGGLNGNGSGDGSADARRLACAVAYNLALTVPAGDATAAGGLPDAATQLLCAALEDVGGEADDACTRTRLLAAGRLVQRAGAAARELVDGLGYGDALHAMAVGAGQRGAPLRSLAAEVAALARSSDAASASPS